MLKVILVLLKITNLLCEILCQATISRKGVKIFLLQIWVLFIGELKWEYNYVIYKIKGVQVFKHLPSQSCVDSCTEHTRILSRSLSPIQQPVCDLWIHLQRALIMFKFITAHSSHLKQDSSQITWETLRGVSEYKSCTLSFPDRLNCGYKIISSFLALLHEKCVREVGLEVWDF